MERAASAKLEGLSEKIFLDRYAWKNADPGAAAVGDVVLALTKDDPKFPTKEVGEVVARRGGEAIVRLRSGETIEVPVDRLTLTVEKTPDEMWDRLAAAISAVEESDEGRQLWRERFRYILDDWKLVPGGRIAAGAGASEQLTLFNCYVIPSPRDSRGGIMRTLSEMTEIMARGGGVGINLSSLRPRRAIVAGVNGASSGAVSWGGLFSYTTGLIEQGGSRRGALMLMINDWHPDLLDFITVKQTMGAVTNANLSVCVSNGFMRAVKENLDWEMVFPDTQDPEFDELWDGDLEGWRRRGKRVVIYKTMPARDIWHSLIESAWKSAEPGVVFMERYNEMSNSWYFNPIISTNPCGEQGLPGWGVCNLSAVNLSRFYDEDRQDVDWDELAKVTRWAVRFLDNVIDATPYHFEENERNQKRERRIGLGTMGLAELMIKLRIRYGSAESLTFLDKLYGFMARESYLASTDIAAEKGSFPAFEADQYRQSGFMRELIGAYPEVGEAIAAKGMRNVTVITQAPTGSTGTMVGTSTGIEPYFAFEYFRQSRLGHDKQYVPIAQAWKDAHPGEELPDYFVTAMSLSAEDHIRVQAAIQRWVDSSISKTANCPADFTVKDTERLYELAYELGCKGVTIYRDGSRDVQVLSTGNNGESPEPGGSPKLPQTKPVADEGTAPKSAETDAFAGKPSERPGAVNGSGAVPGEGGADAAKEHEAKIGIEITVDTDEGRITELKGSALRQTEQEPVVDRAYKRRPQVLSGATYKLNTPFGMAYITINDLNGSPGEIFLNVGKAGSDVFAMAEALGRVCSLFLRYGDHGNKVKLLIKHLKGIGGTGAIGFGANRVESIADAVAIALEMHTEGGNEETHGRAAAGKGSSEMSGTRDGASPSDISASSELRESGTAARGEAAGRQHDSLDLCPSCGAAALINTEGCRTCANCGYSRCT